MGLSTAEELYTTHIYEIRENDSSHRVTAGNLRKKVSLPKGERERVKERKTK